jgi:uridine kinase
MRAERRIAQVILLAGPSGSGKSYVARHSGVPVLPLDDFYLNGDDPRFPRIGSGAAPDEQVGASIDWESPTSWDSTAAVAAIELLARTGTVEVPHYDISVDHCTGYERLTLGDSPVFVAEGIFAAEIAAVCRERGVLAGAYVLRRPRVATFLRRLVRDLLEHRKPPGVLLRRGLRLYRAEPRIVARQQALGCRPATASGVRRAIAAAMTPTATPQIALS